MVIIRHITTRTYDFKSNLELFEDPK
eukprot:UN06974